MSITTHAPELHSSGEDLGTPAAGALTCTGCGYALSLAADDTLPICPTCGNDEFRRAPLFSGAKPATSQETVAGSPIEVAETEPTFVSDARARLAAGECALIWEDDGEVDTRELPLGWTRVGRSGSADVRFDDPTVSRRHALIVRTDEGELRALDDRSLNGLHVNGKRVEWSPLGDGDELEIGRYRVYVIRGA